MNPSDYFGGDLKTLGPYLVPALIALIIIRRNLRPRPLKVERMWFYPSLMLIAGGLMMVRQPPPLQPFAIGLVLAATAVGVGIGWQRGRLTHITVDPETHDLTSKSSPLGMILILGLFALKYALNFIPLAKELPVSAMVLTDASLLFGIGLLITQRLEMWTRARHLLADAQAAKLAKTSPTIPPSDPGAQPPLIE